MAERLYYADTLKVGSVIITNSKILSKLALINKNNYLKKVIERFKVTVQKFISWVCHKFSAPSEDLLIRNFEKETYTNFNIEKQLKVENVKKERQEDELE